MTEERKADVAGKLAELEHELWLAIKQGELGDGLDWSAVIAGAGVPDPWFVVLTAGVVKKAKKP